MRRTTTIVSTCPEATERIGKALADILLPGMVVALRGTLGSGKTVLSRGLARGLGIVEPVTSPTFTVVQEYQRDNSTWFFHLDMYRIADTESALAFGIEEYLFSVEGITAVEWPERIEDLLNTDRDSARTDLVNVTLSHADRDSRRIDLAADLYSRLEPALKGDPDLSIAPPQDHTDP